MSILGKVKNLLKVFVKPFLKMKIYNKIMILKYIKVEFLINKLQRI